MATRHATLIANAVTPIVIGKSTTDIGGIIYYACQRGTLRGMGKIIVDLVNPIIAPVVTQRFDDCGISGITCTVDENYNLSLNIAVDNSSALALLLDYKFVKHTQKYQIPPDVPVTLDSTIYFTTVDASANMQAYASAGMDGSLITWHWSDGTTSQGSQVTKSFGTAATRYHSVVIPEGITIDVFGHYPNTRTGISEITGLVNDATRNTMWQLYIYLEPISQVDILGLTALDNLHLAGTGLGPFMNEFVIALAASIDHGPEAYYAPSSITWNSTSLAARQYLGTLGWSFPTT